MAESVWIRVQDRLPDNGKSVLLMTKSPTSDRNDGLCVGWSNVKSITGDRYWCVQTGLGYYTDLDEAPTHWMPLPGPPKEVAE